MRGMPFVLRKNICLLPQDGSDQKGRVSRCHGTSPKQALIAKCESSKKIACSRRAGTSEMVLGIYLVLGISILELFPSSVAFAQSPHGPGLKLDCSYCHLPTTWNVMPMEMKFNHDKMTSFPLVGQHARVSCASCHKDLAFSDAKSACVSCHTDVHKGTLGMDCQSCHSSQTWVVADVEEIHQRTRFPLVGAHQNVDCASCHTQYAQMYFPPISTQCITCHSQQYYSSTAPNHVQTGFSTQCQTCHGVAADGWGPTDFNHSFFPLVGGHNIQNCFACHQSGNNNFSGLSTACYSCHTGTFAATTNPNHVTAGFPHNCAECHSITDWTSVTFNHNSTGFPLTGAHINVQCSQCHTGGYATSPSTACIGCHQTDYNNTSNPPHASAGYPTDCTQCHTTTAWTPSTFNHTYFPITSGHHASPPLQCSECHTDISNFAIFSCTTSGCHAQSETDQHHNGVSGYVYSPTSCYTCHANGRGGD